MYHTWKHSFLESALHVYKNEYLYVPTQTILDIPRERLTVIKDALPENIKISLDQANIHLHYPSVHKLVCELLDLKYIWGEGDRPQNTKSIGSVEDDLIKESIIYHHIEENITRHKIRAGILSYYYKSKKVTTEVSHSYEDLLAAKMLRQGYKIEIIPGSHFYVWNGLRYRVKGKHHVTTHNCSCVTYETYKECNHRILIKSLVNRKLLRYLRALELR